MHSETVRFGPVEYDPRDVIQFPEGIVPFANAHRFLIIRREDEAPFSWLQSLDDPGLALVAAALDELFPKESAEIRQHLAHRDPEHGTAPLVLLALIVLDPDPNRITANLLAPIVLDPRTMRAEQVVLDGQLSLARQPIRCGTRQDALH